MLLIQHEIEKKNYELYDLANRWSGDHHKWKTTRTEGTDFFQDIKFQTRVR